MRSAPPKGLDYQSPFAHPVELISSVPRDDFRMPVTGSGSRQPSQLPAFRQDPALFAAAT